MDTVRGPVVAIVDGDTFDLKVTHVGKSNQFRYNDYERIRIAGIDAPELDALYGIRSKNKLQTKLLYKEVRCTIKARDTYGRILADIQLLGGVQ